jgi:hypothetical protein
MKPNRIDDLTARQMAAEALGRPTPRLGRPTLVCDGGNFVTSPGAVVVVAPGDPNHRGGKGITQIKVGL